MNTSPDGQICMIGKNIEKKERVQGWPVGRSMGPPGNGSYLLPPLVYIIIIIIIIYNTSFSLAIAPFSHYIILYRYISCVYMCAGALTILYTTLTCVYMRVRARFCMPVRIYICIVLNDVSQHGLYIIFAEPPHCRFTDILYINIIKRHLIRPHSSQSVRTVCATKTDQNESKVLEKITSSYKTYIP